MNLHQHRAFDYDLDRQLREMEHEAQRNTTHAQQALVASVAIAAVVLAGIVAVLA